MQKWPDFILLGTNREIVDTPLVASLVHVIAATPRWHTFWMRSFRLHVASVPTGTDILRFYSVA